MSDFDFIPGDGGNTGGFGDFEGQPRKYNRAMRGGAWYVPLTILGLALVGGLSILMCFLTRNVADRPIWMMGLIFMVPAGAMFFSAMLLEFKTGVMTPYTSRKPQVIVAVVATLLTFLVGCVCDAIYLYGFRSAGVNFVFAVDRGDTISWPADGEEGPTRGEALNACAGALLNRMPYYTDVGVIAFEWATVGVHDFEKATDRCKGQMAARLDVGGHDGVSFYNALEAAANMALQAEKRMPTRILMLTGGDEAAYLIDDNGNLAAEIGDKPDYAAQTVADAKSRQEIIQRLIAADCTLYVITPDGRVSDGLRAVADATGGFCVSIAESAEKEEFVSIVTIDGDMLRATTTPAKALTFIMLLLEGLVVGVCISIMLSCTGQWRLQTIISPVMAMLCFVMVKLLGCPDSNPLGLWWLWEGVSFLPLGLIFMRSNEGILRHAPRSAGKKNDSNGFGDMGDNVGSSDPWNLSSSGGSSVNW